MSSPVLWGPSNISNNLQNSMMLGTGALVNSNGPLNYITYGNFENNATTGWSLGIVGALTNGIPTATPTFGTGASGNLSLTTVSTGQLSGNYSLSLVSSAITTAGNMMATQAYTVNASDQAKVLTYKFNYNIPSGVANGNFSGTSLNTYAVACYDVTNSSWLPMVGNFAMTQATGAGTATGTFQTNSTTASIRFVVYCASASLGAISVNFDDVYVGPQTSPIGYVGTDWTAVRAFTPVNFGTISNVVWNTRRVGDSLEVVGYFTAGTTVASTASLTLPPGMSIDSSKIPSGSGGTIIGMHNGTTTSTNAISTGVDQAYIFYDGSTTGSVFFAGATSANALSKAAASGICASNQNCTLSFTIPILGWSSNVQMSSDTDTRVVAANYSNPSVGSVTANTGTLNFSTLVFDTYSAVTTGSIWKFTAPVTGFYRVYGSTQVSSGVATIQLYKNGVVQGYMGYAPVNVNAFSRSVQMNAGDYIDVRTDTTAIFGNSDVCVERLSGPSVIAATETISASYWISSNFAASTTIPINFDSKEYDDHGAVTTSATAWKFVAPSTGLYGLKYFGEPTTVVSAELSVYKNGVLYRSFAYINAGQNNGGTFDIRLNAGDYIDIRPTAATTFIGGPLNGINLNIIQILRVGN